MSFTNQTQMSKSPFQNLDAVSALKEISDKSAAICSGGADTEEKITLYDAAGKEQSFTKKVGQGEDNLDDEIFGSGWNNRATAVKISGGGWKLYDGDNFEAFMTNVIAPDKKIELGKRSGILTSLKRVA